MAKLNFPPPAFGISKGQLQLQFSVRIAALRIVHCIGRQPSIAPANRIAANCIAEHCRGQWHCSFRETLPTPPSCQEPLQCTQKEKNTIQCILEQLFIEIRQELFAEKSRGTVIFREESSV